MNRKLKTAFSWLYQRRYRIMIIIMSLLTLASVARCSSIVLNDDKVKVVYQITNKKIDTNNSSSGIEKKSIFYLRCTKQSTLCVDKKKVVTDSSFGDFKVGDFVSFQENQSDNDKELQSRLNTSGLLGVIMTIVCFFTFMFLSDLQDHLPKWKWHVGYHISYVESTEHPNRTIIRLTDPSEEIYKMVSNFLKENDAGQQVRNLWNFNEMNRNGDACWLEHRYRIERTEYDSDVGEFRGYTRHDIIDIVVPDSIAVSLKLSTNLENS